MKITSENPLRVPHMMGCSDISTHEVNIRESTKSVIASYLVNRMNE